MSCFEIDSILFIGFETAYLLDCSVNFGVITFNCKQILLQKWDWCFTVGLGSCVRFL